MKLPALLLALILASCTQTVPESWKSTPNPQDVPATRHVEPEANGYWGPFGTAPAGHRNFSGSP